MSFEFLLPFIVSHAKPQISSNLKSLNKFKSVDVHNLHQIGGTLSFEFTLKFIDSSFQLFSADDHFLNTIPDDQPLWGLDVDDAPGFARQRYILISGNYCCSNGGDWSIYVDQPIIWLRGREINPEENARLQWRKQVITKKFFLPFIKALFVFFYRFHFSFNSFC